jgi:hypothetical protein
MADFFDFYCDRCDTPFCERVQIMNLALDYVEEMVCLTCLATDQGTSEAALAASLKTYIDSRECFQTPWNNAREKALTCPLIASHACHCQDEPA